MGGRLDQPPTLVGLWFLLVLLTLNDELVSNLNPGRKHSEQ